MVFAFRFVTHTEQARAIVRRDDIGNLTFWRREQHRPQRERARVNRVERSSIVLFARNHPQRRVVGRELVWVPSLGVTMKRMLGDSLKGVAVFAPVFPHERAALEP